MEVGSLLNHVNSCVLCVCLLFNFPLFTVIDLSPGVLSAQQLLFGGYKGYIGQGFNYLNHINCTEI